jgi:arsenate reductase
MSIVLYGIKNCDSVRKARKWLDSHGIEYRFHDFRQDGLQADAIKQWLKQVDLDTLVNKRSTTWRNISDSDKANFENTKIDACIEFLVANPTLIKRPVLQSTQQLLVGFKAEQYSTLL